ncbi:MAG: DUF1266 domain-containing protein [Helicobacteraceae bacterium]|jgi:hypothetical protein|nr:DUF1266 domain-containing protein [Helicobacteraceae bacterium]
MSVVWVAVLLLIGAAIYVVANPNAKAAIKSLTRRDFAKSAEGAQISQTRRRALLAGLINSEQAGFIGDSLATGSDRKRIEKTLANVWGVVDKQSAVAVLNWLRQSGHRSSFGAVLPYVLKRGDRLDRQKAIEKEFGENAAELCKYADHLIACMDSKKERPIFTIDKETLSKGILAWDASRMIVTARMAYESGYIDEKVAWAVIENGYDAAAASYENWREFAIGYLIGRAMWGGDSNELDKLCEIAQKALNDKKSLWKTIAFK